MKQTKIQFKDIKGMLNRDEMKQIKGGSGDSTTCNTSADCKAIYGSGTNPSWACNPNTHKCQATYVY